MTKVDPYNIQEKYLKWKVNAQANGIVSISRVNSITSLQYLQDTEQGRMWPGPLKETNIIIKWC